MQDITEKCNSFVSDLSSTKDVVSIVLYGSAVSGEYKEGTSDINIAVILKSVTQDTLDSLSQFTKKWKKMKISTPLVISETELRRSTDAFPVELFSIKHSHKTLFGKDVFEKLLIPKEFLRTQLEFELRSRLIRARELYLEQRNDKSKLRAVLVASLPSFSPLFTGLLRLKVKDIPRDQKEQIQLVASKYKVDMQPFLDAYDSKYSNRKVKDEEILSDVSSIIDITEKLIAEID